jgi:hypothetical protein
MIFAMYNTATFFDNVTISSFKYLRNSRIVFAFFSRAEQEFSHLVLWMHNLPSLVVDDHNQTCKCVEKSTFAFDINYKSAIVFLPKIRFGSLLVVVLKLMSTVIRRDLIQLSIVNPTTRELLSTTDSRKEIEYKITGIWKDNENVLWNTWCHGSDPTVSQSFVIVLFYRLKELLLSYTVATRTFLTMNTLIVSSWPIQLSSRCSGFGYFAFSIDYMKARSYSLEYIRRTKVIIILLLSRTLDLIVFKLMLIDLTVSLVCQYLFQCYHPLGDYWLKEIDSRFPTTLSIYFPGRARSWLFDFSLFLCKAYESKATWWDIIVYCFSSKTFLDLVVIMSHGIVEMHDELVLDNSLLTLHA